MDKGEVFKRTIVIKPCEDGSFIVDAGDARWAFSNIDDLMAFLLNHARPTMKRNLMPAQVDFSGAKFPEKSQDANRAAELAGARDILKTTRIAEPHTGDGEQFREARVAAFGHSASYHHCNADCDCIRRQA